MNYSRDTARHEAAHFVVHWAIGFPAYQVDITPEGQREGELGITKGCPVAPTNVADILVSIAGPVADNWECDNFQLFENCKNEIGEAIKDYKNGNQYHSTHSDWESCVHSLYLSGVDILDGKQLEDSLNWYIDAVRSILKQCNNQWNEATEHLVKYGRIGFDGEHPDQGQGAEYFFFRWGDDYGRPPKGIQNIANCHYKTKTTYERTTR